MNVTIDENINYLQADSNYIVGNTIILYGGHWFLLATLN